MSYTKLTDFASKDALLSGNPSKLLRGTEIGAEFDAIESAMAAAEAVNITAPIIAASTSKTTPVNADVLPILDSAAANILKKVTWANVKATLKTYFDTLYAAVGSFAASGANADITSLASPAIAAATATTQAVGDSTTKVATTAFVRQFRQAAQILTVQTGAFASGTTILPYDDTIPQSTEGDQYMSLAITPKDAASTLEIDVEWIGGNSVINNIGVALFQDSAASALAVAQGTPYNPSSLLAVPLKHVMTSGTTSATTFKVRAGGSLAGTTYFNGVSGARLFGGVLSSRITIKEYLP